MKRGEKEVRNERRGEINATEKVVGRRSNAVKLSNDGLNGHPLLRKSIYC